MRNDDALFQLGMDLEALTDIEPRSTTQTEDNTTTNLTSFSKHKHDEKTVEKSSSTSEPSLDYFVTKDGETFAGSHIIIDLYDAEGLNDQARIKSAMLECVEQAGATLLHIHLHPFEPTGVSGVAVLAESHISVHTWPENGYAAFDVFMCGDTKPETCIDILSRAFNAGRIEVKQLKRGTDVLNGSANTATANGPLIGL
ncbi:MAG: adenosylmethionine decarboxylase [Hyphomicrobiales bacterium]